MQNIEDIYKEYFETVYKYLFYLSHDNYLSEELTQETFYKAITKIHTFKGESQISTWLCQIAKNLLYNELKRKKKLNLVEEKELDLVIANNQVEDNVILKEEKDEMYNKIKSLDSITQEVINLRINGNLSFKEIGIILNKSENWARVVFYRGKNKMKEGDLDESK